MGTDERGSGAGVARARASAAEEVMPLGWEVHRGERVCSSASVARVIGLRIDLRHGTVHYEDGCPTRLTESRAAMVVALATRPGVFLSRRELMARLPEPFHHKLAADGVALRQTFPNGAFRRQPGKGYCLDPTVPGQAVPPSLHVGGSWTLCPTHLLLTCRGREPISLNARDGALLHLLVRNAGEIVTYEQASDALRIETETRRPAVALACSSLRAHIRSLPVSIETVWNVGYRLVLKPNAPPHAPP